jgi:hypothetical protein
MKRLVRVGILPTFLALNLYGGSLFQQPAPQPPRPSRSTALTAPADTVYYIFLKELVAFQKKAEDLERKGLKGDYYRTEHQQVTELSDRQFATVRDVATRSMQDVQAYDEQAAGIIKRVKNGVKAAGPGARVPPLPQELIDLEQTRKARILAAVEEIRTALGPGAFLYFDKRVRNHLNPNLSRMPPAAVPPAPGSTRAAQ